MKTGRIIVAGVAVVLGITSARADIILAADPDYPAGAAMFTLDPELYSPAQRGITATRHLRQTFQLGSTIEVAGLVTSVAVGSSGVNAGLVISIYEVADVNASSWSAGTLMHSFAISTNSPLPTTSSRLGFTFTGADIFTLPQRNTGAEGYGLEVSNGDDVTQLGNWRHSNDGTNHYPDGVFYNESGSIPNSARDIGIALVAVPEPSVALLMLGGAGLIGFVRRRRR